MEQSGTVWIAHLEGNLGPLAEPRILQVERALLDVVDRNPRPRLLLDLAGTDYFGSSFIETLVRVWNRVNRSGGEFAICGLNPLCFDILHTARLDRLWKVSDENAEKCADQLRAL